MVILALAAVLMPAAASRADEAAPVVSERFERAVWRLAAFLPPAANGPEVRTLTVAALGHLPPVRLECDFSEPLSPWPRRITLTFRPGETRRPDHLEAEDVWPFGAARLKQAPAGEAPRELSAGEFTALLENLADRLETTLPLLAGPPEWRESQGLQLAKVRLLYGVRLGEPNLYLVRIDPARFEVAPHHECEYPEAGRTDLNGWAERLPEAAFLINGGQYYPNRESMGRLSRDGTAFAPERHRQWKGFLATEPKAEAPPRTPQAAIIDLETHREAFGPDDYRNVAQSFMLRDRLGRIRVKNSYNLASRSAIGQDREGRLWGIMAPGAISLHDLARVLGDPALGLVSVIGLDGGFEAQMMLRRNGTPFVATGHFSISAQRALYLPGYTNTLPLVISCRPRREEPARNP